MELTKDEKVMKTTALAYALMFAGAVSVFIFAPGLLFDVINGISRDLFPALPAAADSGKFWLSMTVSMMAVIIALSLFIHSDVKKNHMMAIPLVTAKFTSSFFGLAFFILGFASGSGTNTLANLVIFITDFPLGLFMLLVWRRMRNG